MPISIACPSCSKRFTLPESAAGKTGRCKDCGQVFKIPTLGRAVPSPSSEPSPSASIDQLRYADIPGLVDEDDSDDHVAFPPQPTTRSSQAPAAAPSPRAVNDAPDVLGFDDDDLADEMLAGSAPPPRNAPRKSTWPSASASASPQRRRDSSLPVLPIGIFAGGSLILWGFLLFVVQPSMQGRDQSNGPVAQAEPGPIADAVPVPAPNADRPRFLPGVAPEAPGLPPQFPGVMGPPTVAANGFPQLQAPGPDDQARPFVEVFIEGVSDGETTEVLQAKLASACDDPATANVAFVFVGGTKGASFRASPVADAAAFARKLNFGTTKVTDRTIQVSNLKLDPADRAEIEKKIAARAAEAPKHEMPTADDDPVAPPGADAITKALVKLQSSNDFRKREGLKELTTTLPDEARRDEVVKAIVPLVTSTDHFNAIEAARALSNWPSEPTIDALIHVVKQSDDHFVRVEAMNTLGKLKSEKAIPAIVSRLSDDWVDAPNALRAIGAPAEKALIGMLTDPEPKQRRAVCEILADLGGVATFEAMSKLPADPEFSVQVAARQAMEAIGNRIGPDEVRRIQSAARKKK